MTDDSDLQWDQDLFDQYDGDDGIRVAVPNPLPYVSRRAVKRVRDPVPVPERCPYKGCDGRMLYLSHLDIYGKEYGNWPYVLACDTCDARVGLHPGTDIPLGTVARQELRDARKFGKNAFYRLQKERGWSRREAYQWLAGQLGITEQECHWSWFDIAQCDHAIEVCNEALEGDLE